ncbi:hypothetical protein [Candidatus Cyanaurora vandensis]|uniref:hypothetical protein n=1 Tax=Candidatus Cyanaurora vandensis TaxID=2714958 RepID=UPI00257E1892|nr:hypothetical protein [Candidatus Cyanaurora vandensis]
MVGYLLIAVFLVGHLGISYYASTVVKESVYLEYLQATLYACLLLGLSISPTQLIVNRLTTFFGKISYSVYLSHATIIIFISPVYPLIYRVVDNVSIGFALSRLLAFMVIVPLSYLTFKFIELPTLQLGRDIAANYSKT